MPPFILERESFTGGQTTLIVEQLEDGDLVIVIEQEHDTVSFVLKDYEVEDLISALDSRPVS